MNDDDARREHERLYANDPAYREAYDRSTAAAFGRLRDSLAELGTSLRLSHWGFGYAVIVAILMAALILIDGLFNFLF